MTGDKDNTCQSLTWEKEISLLANPLVRRQMLVTVLIAGLFMALLLSFMMLVTGEISAIPGMLLISIAAAAGLGLLLLLVVLIFFNNRYRVRFTLNSQGVLWETVDPKAKNAGRLALLLGAVSGSPHTAGAGMLSAAREKEFISWKEIRSYNCNRRHRLIVFRNSWRVTGMVACNPENYRRAISIFAEKAGTGAGSSLTKRQNPLPKLLLRSLLAVVASFPVFTLPYPFTPDLFLPLCMLLFALATVWLIPFLGWAVMGCAAFLAAEIIVTGMTVKTSTFTWMGTYRNFELLRGDEWFLLGLAFAGMIYLVWFSWQSVRGKVTSGLMED